MPLFQCAADDPRVELFRRLLRQRGWLTAREVLLALDIEDGEANRRQVRAWAHACGADVVKGQRGFNLLENLRAKNELDDALRAAHQAEAQGREMIEYALALKRRLHALVG